MERRIIRQKSGYGIISQIPLWLLALSGIAMLGYILAISFTSFNVIEAPKFIGLDNYTAFKNDDLIKHIFKNTRGFVLITAGALAVTAVIPALLISRIKPCLGAAVIALYSLVSLLALLPSNLRYVFSGDGSGLLNALLVHNGVIEAPIAWGVEYAPVTALIAFYLICLAPVFAVAYIFARHGRKTAGAAVSLCAVPIFMFMASGYVQGIVGFPSADYSADWLPTLINDYFNTRFEVGFAYALVIKGISMLINWCFGVCAVVLAVWLIGKKIKISENALGVFGWVSLGFSVFMFLIGIFPAVFIFMNAFKPIDEFFLYPPAVMPIRPTFKNFSDYFLMLDNFWDFNVPLNAFYGSIISMPLYCIYLFAAVIPCAAGFALFRFGKARPALLIPFVFLPLLTPALRVNYDALSLNMLSFVSGLGFPLTVYLTYTAIKMIAARVNAKSLTFGILFIISAFCSTAIINHNFSSSIPLHIKNYNLYGLNYSMSGAGIARMGSAAAGDLLLLLFALLSVIPPLVMFLLLYREYKKAPV